MEFETNKPHKVTLDELAENDLLGIMKSMFQSEKTTLRYIENFEVEIDVLLNLIAEFPYIGKGVNSSDDKMRFRSVPNYDYAIYYVVEDSIPEIVAFALIPEKAGQETIDGLLNERVKLLASKKQVVFRTEKSIDKLKFTGSHIIEALDTKNHPKS